MEDNANRIACPNCGQEIDVNELLYHQLDEELGRKYAARLAEEQQKFQGQLDDLEKQRRSLEVEKKDFQKKLDGELASRLRAEKKKLGDELRKQAEEEQAEQVKALQNELNEKSKKLQDFNKAKSEIERLKREKDELRTTVEAESDKKLNAVLAEERRKIHAAEEEKALLKLSERDHIIEQLKDQLREAQRKAEQGSMQLQGEVQELAIEEWLQENFPLDTIEEIKKGARGGDCLQHIHTRSRQQCGTVYYESKRTKAFQPGWIEKFKNDIRDRGADIGVLVTEAMPSDMERMGFRDGVWICSFEEFKGPGAARIPHPAEQRDHHPGEQGRQDGHALRFSHRERVPFADRGHRGGLCPDAERPGVGEALHAGYLEETREADREGPAQHQLHVQLHQGDCRQCYPARGIARVV